MASLMLMLLWLYRVHVQSISTCVERFRTIGRVKSRGIDRNQLHVIPARWFVVELCWAWWIDFYTISDRQLVTDIVSKICTEWSHWVPILRCVMSVVVVTCDAATEAFKPTYVYMGMCSEWNDWVSRLEWWWSGEFHLKGIDCDQWSLIFWWRVLELLLDWRSKGTTQWYRALKYNPIEELKLHTYTIGYSDK